MIVVATSGVVLSRRRLSLYRIIAYFTKDMWIILRNGYSILRALERPILGETSIKTDKKLILNWYCAVIFYKSGLFVNVLALSRSFSRKP